MNRDELIGRRLQAVAERLCGGSLTPLLTNLVRSKRLTPRERREIRKLMDELERFSTYAEVDDDLDQRPRRGRPPKPWRRTAESPHWFEELGIAG